MQAQAIEPAPVALALAKSDNLVLWLGTPQDVARG